MKINRVLANNRKKAFVLETSRGKMDYPYSRLRVKPQSSDPVIHVAPDRDLGKEGFTYVLKSGKANTIHSDSVLEYHQDPDYICELMLHNLTVRALELLKAQQTPKRELARRLKTSPKQLYRLLDPTDYGKTINQMVRLLHVMGQSVEIVIKKAA
jgi:hypothetical protein